MSNSHNNSTHSSTCSSSPQIGIGIDFGTSNSAVALYDGKQVRLVQLEPKDDIMPSATYVDNKFKISTGQDAIDAYIKSNTGRRVELSAELLGEGRTTTGQIGDKGLPEEGGTEKMYGQSLVDAGQKGRLFRGIKRLLGSNTVQRLMVFDRPFRLVALITPLLLRMFKSTEAQLKQVSPSASSDHACLGHPVNFEGKEGEEKDRNLQALGKLSESANYAGFSQQSFCPEPTAAALSYLRSERSEGDKTMLAVDFGGGTLDLAILKNIGNDFEVVVTHGIGLGGDHIDQMLFRKLICPLLGKGERWRRAGADMEIETLFPFDEYEELLMNWPISYMLNQNKYTSPLTQRIQQGDEAAEKFSRLYEVIKRNYSYLIFQTIKDVKARLSSVERDILDIPEIDIAVEIRRAEFEDLISPLVAEFQQAITETLSKANIAATQIDVVIRTGGSCLIPVIKRSLDQHFPDRVVEHDPFTGVAAGLAIAEFEGLGHTLSNPSSE